MQGYHSRSLLPGEGQYVEREWFMQGYHTRSLLTLVAESCSKTAQ